MISYLKGKLVEILPNQVTMEVGGVGYQVHIPLSTFDKLPAAPADYKLLTHLQVREDAHILYGFATKDGKKIDFPTAAAFCQWMITENLISSVPWDDVGAYVRFSVTFIAKGEVEEKRVIAELEKRLSAYKFAWD